MGLFYNSFSQVKSRMDMEIKVRILFGSISLFAIWMNESICTNAMMSKKEWQRCWNYMLGPPDRD